MRQTQITKIVHETLRADRTHVPRERVSQVIQTFLDAVAQVLRGGNSATLQGFGTFYVHRYRGRGATQRTKAHAASWQPKFRAGRTLKKTVNAGR